MTTVELGYRWIALTPDGSIHESPWFATEIEAEDDCLKTWALNAQWMIVKGSRITPLTYPPKPG